MSQLRDYQSSACYATLNHAKYMDGHGYIMLPTGAGKSHVIAELASKLPGNVLVLADRKELLEQNHAKFPNPLEVGIYSAGLGVKDYSKRITVAGIQSVAANPPTHPIDWLIIDECDRVPDNQDIGKYWELQKLHPKSRIIGLTATPYRLKSGKLKWGEEIFSIGYKPLMDKGWLCPLVNKCPLPEDFNVNAEVTSMGDYKLSDIEAQYIDEKLLNASIAKLMEYSAGRNHVLIFVSTVKHGEILQAALMELHDVVAPMVTANSPKDERKEYIKYFRNGRFKYLINCELYTRGFDAPCVDMIAIFRPTKSKALHEQILGRGVRLNEGKRDCLVLDMAGNLREHGGLGSPYIENAKGKDKAAKRGRICPVCETFIEGNNIEDCPDCGFHFIKEPTPEIKHNKTADTESETVYRGSAESQIKEYQVNDIIYSEHLSKAGNLGIKVTYICGYDSVVEYISSQSEHEFARGKAWNWFKQRGITINGDIKDVSIDDLLLLCNSPECKRPITVSTRPQKNNPKYTEVFAVSFATQEEENDANAYGIVPEELEDSIPFAWLAPFLTQGLSLLTIAGALC